MICTPHKPKKRNNSSRDDAKMLSWYGILNTSQHPTELLCIPVASGQARLSVDMLVKPRKYLKWEIAVYETQIASQVLAQISADHFEGVDSMNGWMTNNKVSTRRYARDTRPCFPCLSRRNKICNLFP